MSQIPFRAISVFYEVATQQSVAAAAERLGVTPSAVSQQLRNLEEQVGKVLVAKVGRKIRLTEAGEQYYEMIAEDVEHIITSTNRIRGAQTTTLLTVRASPSIATKWLLPRLPRFLDANPDLDVHLDGSNEPTDFARDTVDIGVYHGTGRWPGLHVQPLVDEPFLPVCAPTLTGLDDLAISDIPNHRMIVSVKCQVQWRDWFGLAGHPDLEARRRVLFDRSHMTVDAACSGMGIALESALMMDRELREGRLHIPVAEVPKVELCTQWLVCPHQNTRRRHVRRFIDWVRAEAEEWRSALDLPMLR
ncbi:LysR substrate-binding domain-containing protein [Tranquillimonas alkanivorans]|uniref:DNA-binding transcriptional regulator, LysR family n=1 Tax=Tranquillimonas alkanivorans TaxID=441119 RepID=A0A1I5VI08_9RHOB|nr:LysR substrate-binding domain-containing protein [Tranquillimonas alkanivorans]SFQ07188.1 DNA-binding transcriptional regulator, LysR family [Tranquillimonas alkanivorans]